MQFTIQFLINNTPITSDSVIRNPSLYQKTFIEHAHLSCTIQLHGPSGTWEIEDELPALAANFFLRSVQELSTAGFTKYEYFEYYGQIEIELMDANVCISGDFVGNLMIEFSLFKELAIELGKHALELLEKLDPEKFKPDLEFIRSALNQVIN